MVDFEKLIGESQTGLPTEPGELFRSLLSSARLPYLRDVQQDLLRDWYSNKSPDQRDTIVKMSTGAGKTIVGLLMLQSSLNEGFGPALYVCPTRQLVEQVQQDADDLGVNAVSLVGKGPLPVEFDNCEKILITTFSKLFNGRSVFGTSIDRYTDVGSIVIDDAHSCLKIAREQVTVTFKSNTTVYKQLFSMFRNSLSDQSRAKTEEIAQEYPFSRLTVPYWVWNANLNRVTELLVSEQQGEELRFSWNLIQDQLDTCHCLFTGKKVEISPRLIPVNSLPSFSEAKRRFFLSATLADDSVLPREFAVEPSAVSNTLRTTGNSDIGERMILIPDLIEPGLGDSLPIQLASLAQSLNVVILVPSKEKAKRWKAAGAEMVIGEAVSGAVLRLRSSQGNFVVLVNRYDGIDLPDDACRILVVDELPIGESLIEQYQASARKDSMLSQGEVAQTIEQGFGRGVRSGKDSCVVLLTGKGLVRFVSTKRTLGLFSDGTQKQVDIGQQISRLAKRESGSGWKKLNDLMGQCIQGDAGWRKFHSVEMSKVELSDTDDFRLKVGATQRKALDLFYSGDPAKSVELVRRLVDEMDGRGNKSDAGWFLQVGASYQDKCNPTEALTMQKRAHQYNSLLLKPRTGASYRRLEQRTSLQADHVREWIQSKISSNAVVSSMGAILDRLVIGGDSAQFEEAWEELGNMLGFDAQRPEHEFNKGSDSLWRMPNNKFLVIEIKNEVKNDRPEIYQSETEQLSNSVNWFIEEYGQDAQHQSVLIHSTKKLQDRAYPPAGSLVIAQECLEKLHQSLRNFASAVAAKSTEAWTNDQLAQLLHDHQLTAGQFVSCFCSEFER